MVFTVQQGDFCCAHYIQYRVYRTSTNWNTLFPHISYIIMCCIIFHTNGHGERERRRERERERKDLISPWEHANER